MRPSCTASTELAISTTDAHEFTSSFARSVR
jgi:hypothetical protein